MSNAGAAPHIQLSYFMQFLSYVQGVKPHKNDIDAVNIIL